MNRRSSIRIAQLVAVLACALSLKFYYSTASVNQLRWILAPTTVLVEIVTGSRFEFESHAGYMKSDHTFLIAASCAGVNFLITSFLMLSLRSLWKQESRECLGNGVRRAVREWGFLPGAALFAYVATILANGVRISTALLHLGSTGIDWLGRDQLHRFEGIITYFGFLLLLFVVSEKIGSPRVAERVSSKVSPSLLRQSLFPLLIYYCTTLAVPLATAAYRYEIAASDFWEHLGFVLLTPLLLLLPLATLRLYRRQRVQLSLTSTTPTHPQMN